MIWTPQVAWERGLSSRLRFASGETLCAMCVTVNCHVHSTVHTHFTAPPQQNQV